MSADAQELWSRTCEVLRAQVSEASWHSHFAELRPLTIGDSHGELVLIVEAGSRLARERLESRFASLLQEAVREVAGRPISVEIQISSVPSPPFMNEVAVVERGRPVEPPAAHALTTHALTTHALSERSAPGPIEPSRFDRYTFEDFVTGQSNRFAHAAAMAVAERPAASYNPLFIYGDSGLGKTHLLHAIRHYIGQNYPNKVTRYITSETFVNEFVDAIRTNNGNAFKRRYRDDCDVLLIDDIQFMEGKESTQEEFFHTFNFLHGAGRQIVISSDRPPKAIPTLEDRLRSRFEWGLITDVQPPELETRLAILRSKAILEQVVVGDPVLTFIATHVTENIRKLEGALNRVAAYASLNALPLDLGLAERVLADLLSGKEQRPITARLIIQTTADLTGFPVEDLVGQSRRRPLVNARQMAMYIFRELTDYSYPMIGREFGGRDHTTVIHAVEKIAAQMKEKRATYDQVTELLRVLQSGG